MCTAASSAARDGTLSHGVKRRPVGGNAKRNRSALASFPVVKVRRFAAVMVRRLRSGKSAVVVVQRLRRHASIAQHDQGTEDAPQQHRDHNPHGMRQKPVDDFHATLPMNINAKPLSPDFPFAPADVLQQGFGICNRRFSVRFDRSGVFRLDQARAKA
jgi:hypothetical protein